LRGSAAESGYINSMEPASDEKIEDDIMLRSSDPGPSKAGWRSRRPVQRSNDDAQMLRIVGAVTTLGLVGMVTWEILQSPPRVVKKVPIPVVSVATGMFGAHIFRSENCISCHKMNGIGSDFGPDLTHEGQLHPDVNWQVENLGHHGDFYPNSAMPDVNYLSPKELRVLAMYMASRR